MFDYHMHTKVSFDSKAEPQDMIAAAERAGLKEICFTDHFDYYDEPRELAGPFDIEEYKKASPTFALLSLVFHLVEQP